MVLSKCIRQRQKPQVPTPQAPIRNRQTRKVASAYDRNRQMIGNLGLSLYRLGSCSGYDLWRLRLFLVFATRILVCNPLLAFPDT